MAASSSRSLAADAPGAPPLILAGPLPPPVCGQTLSFAMLVEEMERLGVPCRVVNLALGSGEQVGAVTPRRLGGYAAALGRFLRVAAGRRTTVYLTISQSLPGFLRDCAMVHYARLFGHRVVLHLKGGNYDRFHAAQPRPLRALVRATLRRADRILVLGERLRPVFGFEPAVAGRVAVVPNGYPEAGEPHAAPKSLPAGEPVRLLYLSNLIASKGYLDVLAAVRLLRERLGADAVRYDFHGAFMASADDSRVRSAAHGRALFESFVAEHGLEDAVRWHGVSTGAAKRAALEGAHVFVLPTAYENEGQPVSIIEAMAHGCVVVSTDFRAIPELVDDGVTGVLVPYGSPEAIAAAVEGLVRDPGRYEAMSRAALERFQARFTRARHLERLVAELKRPSHAEGPEEPEAVSSGSSGPSV
ncbi:MAG TPA: glycosyltransferase family 4 protein [Longimicrobium sp.]|jgi:glycosyltransferase involved in cell wall biosynthesis|nr:glycosyltransferase family 4 protein [Longimicrobium sp.]